MRQKWLPCVAIGEEDRHSMEAACHGKQSASPWDYIHYDPHRKWRRFRAYFKGREQRYYGPWRLTYYEVFQDKQDPNRIVRGGQTLRETITELLDSFEFLLSSASQDLEYRWFNIMMLEHEVPVKSHRLDPLWDYLESLADPAPPFDPHDGPWHHAKNLSKVLPPLTNKQYNKIRDLILTAAARDGRLKK